MLGYCHVFIGECCDFFFLEIHESYNTCLEPEKLTVVKLKPTQNHIKKAAKVIGCMVVGWLVACSLPSMSGLSSGTIGLNPEMPPSLMR